MKKFWGIVSCLILVLIAGVTFYACGDSETPLSISTSATEVEVIIGDSNNATKSVDFVLENYGDGSTQLNFSTDSPDLITYSSSTKNNGKTTLAITAIHPGTAKITARSLQGNVSTTITVKVIQPITGLAMSTSYDGKIYAIAGKSLNLAQDLLFVVSPLDTNQTDLQFTISGEDYGCSIVNNRLVVPENCTATTISILATATSNEDCYVEFDVKILKPIIVDVSVDGKTIVEELSEDPSLRAGESTNNYIEIFPLELDGAAYPNSKTVILTIKAGEQSDTLKIVPIFNTTDNKFSVTQMAYQYNTANNTHVYTFEIQSNSVDAGKIDSFTFDISYDGKDAGEDNYVVSSIMLNLNSYNKPATVEINGISGEANIDIFENSINLTNGELLQFTVLPGALKSGENKVRIWAENQNSCGVSLYKINATRTGYICVFGYDQSGNFISSGAVNGVNYLEISSGAKLYAFINSKYSSLTSNNTIELYAQSAEYCQFRITGAERAFTKLTFIVNPNAESINLAIMDEDSILEVSTDNRIVVEYDKVSTQYLAIAPATFVVGSSSAIKLTNPSLAEISRMTTYSSDDEYVYVKFTITAKKTGTTRLVVTLSDGKTASFDLVIVSSLHQIDVGLKDVTQNGLILESDIIPYKNITDPSVIVGEEDPTISLNKLSIANSGGSGIQLDVATNPSNAQYFLTYSFCDYVLPENKTLKSIILSDIDMDEITFKEANDENASEIINTSRMHNYDIIEAVSASTIGNVLVKIEVNGMQGDGTYDVVGYFYYLINFFIKAQGLQVENGTLELYSYETVGDKFVNEDGINKSIGQFSVKVKAQAGDTVIPTYIDNLKIYVNGNSPITNLNFENNICYLNENGTLTNNYSDAVLKLVRTLSNNTYTYTVQALKSTINAYVFALVLTEVDETKSMTDIARVFVKDAVEITDIEFVNANEEDPIYILNANTIKMRSDFMSDLDYAYYLRTNVLDGAGNGMMTSGELTVLKTLSDFNNNATQYATYLLEEITKKIGDYELELIYNIYSNQGADITNSSLEFEFISKDVGMRTTYIDENGAVQSLITVEIENEKTTLKIRKTVVDYSACFDVDGNVIDNTLPSLLVLGVDGFMKVYPTSNYYNSSNGWNGEAPIIQIPITVSDGTTKGTAIRISTASDLDKLNQYPTSIFVIVTNGIVMGDDYVPVENFYGELYGMEDGAETPNSIRVYKPLFKKVAKGAIVQDLYISTEEGILPEVSYEDGVGYLGTVANINEGTIKNVATSAGQASDISNIASGLFDGSSISISSIAVCSINNRDVISGLSCYIGDGAELMTIYHYSSNLSGVREIKEIFYFVLADYVGGLVGWNKGTITSDNDIEISEDGSETDAGMTVYATVFGRYAGGIAGRNTGKIENQDVIGIIMGTQIAGGICAINESIEENGEKSSAQIIDCIHAMFAKDNSDIYVNGCFVIPVVDSHGEKRKQYATAGHSLQSLQNLISEIKEDEEDLSTYLRNNFNQVGSYNGATGSDFIVGGIVGKSTGGEIRDCDVVSYKQFDFGYFSDLFNTSDWVGNLAQALFSRRISEITCDVVMCMPDSWYTGFGLLGGIAGVLENTLLSTSTFEGYLGLTGYAGGLVGKLSKTDVTITEELIQNCYAKIKFDNYRMTVNQDDAAYICNGDISEIKNCYVISNIPMYKLGTEGQAKNSYYVCEGNYGGLIANNNTFKRFTQMQNDVSATFVDYVSLEVRAYHTYDPVNITEFTDDITYYIRTGTEEFYEYTAVMSDVVFDMEQTYYVDAYKYDIVLDAYIGSNHQTINRTEYIDPTNNSEISVATINGFTYTVETTWSDADILCMLGRRGYGAGGQYINKEDLKVKDEILYSSWGDEMSPLFIDAPADVVYYSLADKTFIVDDEEMVEILDLTGVHDLKYIVSDLTLLMIKSEYITLCKRYDQYDENQQEFISEHFGITNSADIENLKTIILNQINNSIEDLYSDTQNLILEIAGTDSQVGWLDFVDKFLDVYSRKLAEYSAELGISQDDIDEFIEAINAYSTQIRTAIGQLQDFNEGFIVSEENIEVFKTYISAIYSIASLAYELAGGISDLYFEIENLELGNEITEEEFFTIVGNKTLEVEKGSNTENIGIMEECIRITLGLDYCQDRDVQEYEGCSNLFGISFPIIAKGNENEGYPDLQGYIDAGWDIAAKDDTSNTSSIWIINTLELGALPTLRGNILPTAVESFEMVLNPKDNTDKSQFITGKIGAEDIIILYYYDTILNLSEEESAALSKHNSIAISDLIKITNVNGENTDGKLNEYHILSSNPSILQVVGGKFSIKGTGYVTLTIEPVFVRTGEEVENKKITVYVIYPITEFNIYNGVSTNIANNVNGKEIQIQKDENSYITIATKNTVSLKNTSYIFYENALAVDLQFTDYLKVTITEFITGTTYYTRTGTEGAYVYTAVEEETVFDEDEEYYISSREAFSVLGMTAGQDVGKYALGTLTLKTLGAIDTTLSYNLTLGALLQTGAGYQIFDTSAFEYDYYITGSKHTFTWAEAVAKINALLGDEYTKSVNISVIEKAQGISASISNAEIDPSNALTIAVELSTSRTKDSLLITINETTNGIRKTADTNLFNIDGHFENLTSNDGKIKTNIIISIADDARSAITKVRTFEITLTDSEGDVSTTILLTVKPQEVISATYSHHNRADNATMAAFTVQNEPSSVLAPGDSGLLMINLFPTYATYSKITITSQMVNSQYYVLFEQMYKSGTTFLVGSGVPGYASERDTNTLTIPYYATTDTDGMIYVRTKILNTIKEGLYFPITITIYAIDEDGNEYIVKSETITLISQIINGASITIDGEKEATVARGHSYSIEVSVPEDQELAEYSIIDYEKSTNINDTINVVFDREQYEIVDGRKIYTGILIIGLDAELNKNGWVQIQTKVARTINGRIETQTDEIMVRIVDFTIEGVRIVGNDEDDNVFNTPLAIEKDLQFEFILSKTPTAYLSTQESSVERINNAKEAFLTHIAYQYKNEEEYTYTLNTDRVFIYDNSRYTTNNTNESIAYDLVYEDGTQYVTTTGRIQNNQYFTLSYNGDANSTILSADTLKVIGTKLGLVNMAIKIAYRLPGAQEDSYFIYNFAINTQMYSDEDKPTPIYTGEQLIEYLTAQNDSYGTTNFILMQDIVLENFVPFTTTNFASLDGNNKIITIKNYDLTQLTTSNNLNLALFVNITKGATVKDLTINYYDLEDIIIDEERFTDINIAGLVINNSGIVYNCEVVSLDFSDNNVVSNETGIKAYFDAVDKNKQKQSGTNLTMAGLAINNRETGCITNSRVGGKGTFLQIMENKDNNGKVIQTLVNKEYNFSPINLIAQGNMSGFVGNNQGVISASYFANGYIINKAVSGEECKTAGFALNNVLEALISGCYVEGIKLSSDISVQITGGGITAQGTSAGFIYENAGQISDSYANVRLAGLSTGRIVSGFVYHNTGDGVVSRCYSASTISGIDSLTPQMPFTGKDARETIMQEAENGIQDCYYLVKKYDTESVLEEKYDTGAIALQIASLAQNSFYGFTFILSENSNDGMWSWNGLYPELVAADNKAISVRKIIENYSALVSGGTSLEAINVFPYINGYEYGSDKNPIIIRTADEYNRVFGQETNLAQGTYYAISQMYNKNSGIVFGNYRLVSHIDFDQLETVENVKVSSSIMMLMPKGGYNGTFDGNGLTISNVEISLNNQSSVGLFSTLRGGAVFKNVSITIKNIVAGKGIYVGGAVGTVENSFLVNIVASAAIQNGENVSKVSGHNIVGGVAGAVIGDSRVANLISSISVVSTYIPATNTIPTINRTHTSVENGVVVDSYNKLSFAGGVVGFIDIYKHINNAYVQSTEANASKLAFYGENISVQGGIVGGVVGFVGRSTYISDAQLLLDGEVDELDQKLISYGNTIGGVVGISYGKLYQLKAEHSTVVQRTIESNLQNYYNTTSDIFRGNINLFNSTTSSLEYIGGLVGQMLSGELTVSYSKIDVSNSSAKYAGGLIGYNDANTTFDQLYAFGDVDGKKAGGLIGVNTGLVNLSRCVAINFYSKTNSLINSALEGGTGTQIIQDLGIIVGFNKLEAQEDQEGNVNSIINNYANTSFEYRNTTINLNSTATANINNLSIAGMHSYKGKIIDGPVINKMFFGSNWDEAVWTIKDGDIFPTFTYGIIDNVLYIEKADDLLKLLYYNKGNNIVIFGDDPGTDFNPYTYVAGQEGTYGGLNAGALNGTYAVDNTIYFDISIMSSIIENHITPTSSYFTSFQGIMYGEYATTKDENGNNWNYVITGMEKALFGEIMGGSVSGLIFDGKPIKSDGSDIASGQHTLSTPVLAINISSQTELSNLAFKNILIETELSNVGIISGTMTDILKINDITIESSTINVNKSSVNIPEAYKVGGISGFVTYSSGNVSEVLSLTNAKITNLHINLGSAGAVLDASENYIYVGQLFGQSMINTRYTDCVISGENKEEGTAPNETIVHDISVYVSGNSSTYIGGFVGDAQNIHTIINTTANETNNKHGAIIKDLQIYEYGGNRLYAGLMFGSVNTFQSGREDGTEANAALNITINGSITAGTTIMAYAGGIVGYGSGYFNSITVNRVNNHFITLSTKDSTNGSGALYSSIGGAIGNSSAGTTTLTNIKVQELCLFDIKANPSSTIFAGGVLGTDSTNNNTTSDVPVNMSAISFYGYIRIYTRIYTSTPEAITKVYVGGLVGSIGGDVSGLEGDFEDNNKIRGWIIVGRDESSTTIGDLFVGGIAGYSNGGIQDCRTDLNISLSKLEITGTLYAGGIAGEISLKMEKIIGGSEETTGNYAWGNINISDDTTVSNLDIGGIAGKLTAAKSTDARFKYNYSMISIYSEIRGSTIHNVRAMIGETTNYTASNNYYCHQINLATDKIGRNCYYKKGTGGIISKFVTNSKDPFGEALGSEDGSKLNPSSSSSWVGNEYYYASNDIYINSGINIVNGAHICGDGYTINASTTPFGKNDGYITGFNIVMTSSNHLTDTSNALCGVATTNNGIIFAVTASVRANSTWALKWDTMVTTGGAVNTGFVGTNNGFIGDCGVSVNVYSIISAGFVGINKGVISNSYATGAIYNPIGAAFINSNNSSGKIYNCYTALDGTSIIKYQSGEVTNFYYDQQATGAIIFAGSNKDTNYMSTTNTYKTTILTGFNNLIKASGDTTGLWTQRLAYNFGYPYLGAGAYASFTYMRYNTGMYIPNAGKLNQLLHSADTSGANSKGMVLLTNIDLSKAIGTSAWSAVSYYSVTFDGNNYKISGINELSVSDSGRIGFFGEISGVTIKNCDFIYNNITITYSSNDIGGVVGGMQGSTLSNVSSSGLTINATASKSYGGLIGYIYGSKCTIKDCSNYNTVSASSGNAGGIAGATDNEKEYDEIKGCLNFADISGVRAGGILGHNNRIGNYTAWGIHNITTIQDSINYGNISGSENIGGIVGSLNNGKVGETDLFCINNGYVTGCSATANVGGIVGDTYDGRIYCCQNNGTISGGYTAGGIVGLMQGGSLSIVDQTRNVGSVNTAVDGSFAGGIVGRMLIGGILRSRNTGNITNTGVAGTQFAAGIAGGSIVGGNDNRGSISDCINEGNIIANAGAESWARTIGNDIASIERCEDYGELVSKRIDDNLTYNDNSTGTANDCAVIFVKRTWGSYSVLKLLEMSGYYVTNGIKYVYAAEGLAVAWIRWPDYPIKLVADIDLSKYAWEPSAVRNIDFNGYKIYNCGSGLFKSAPTSGMLKNKGTVITNNQAAAFIISGNLIGPANDTISSISTSSGGHNKYYRSSTCTLLGDEIYYQAVDEDGKPKVNIYLKEAGKADYVKLSKSLTSMRNISVKVEGATYTIQICCADLTQAGATIIYTKYT